MTIHRAPRKKYYTNLDNDLLKDDRISYRALGILVNILSQADHWKVQVDQLAKARKEKRKAILNALKELKKFGYVHYVKSSFEGGWDYHVYDEPVSEEEFKKSLRTEPKWHCSGKDAKTTCKPLKNNGSNNVYEQSLLGTVPKSASNQYQDSLNKETSQSIRDQGQTDLAFNKKVKDMSKKHVYKESIQSRFQKIVVELIDAEVNPEVIQHLKDKFDEYQYQIKNLDSWCSAVIGNTYDEIHRISEKESVYEKRRDYARYISESNLNNWFYDEINEVLVYISGQIETKYPIKKKLSFWFEKGL